MGVVLVVMACHQGDVIQLQELLRWIKKLGPLKSHKALIVADSATAFTDAINVKSLADEIFADSRLITNEQPVSGWPDGPYSLFTTALKNVAEPFLILEPDAIPLRTGWLDAISEDYARCGQPFMGFVYKCDQPNLPSRLMSGIACYPANAIDYLPIQEKPVHWDVAGAAAMVANGFDSKLFHHFFGEMNLPPTFVPRKTPTSPRNAFTLEDIPGESVIFHRNKDHSLIRLLDRKLFGPTDTAKIVVCFNVHQGDLGLALSHSEWLKRLGTNSHKAYLCYDPSCPVVPLNRLEQNLRQCFSEVENFVYPRPPFPGYPANANWAWQSVALKMSENQNPWLWFEADGVVLKASWLDELQAEYNAAGFSWMGAIVPHLGHLQGTAIYPHDAAQRMPRAMSCGEGVAFDMEANFDTAGDRHDASHLCFHVWTIMNGEFCPVGGGDLPANIRADQARKIPKSSVFIHRVKDDSLIRLLLSGEYRH